PVIPEGIVWLWLVGVGVFASLSHILITFALRFAPSATLAPLHYLEMVSAVFFGYLVFISRHARSKSLCCHRAHLDTAAAPADKA
ncbi:MAG: hypothetical protein ACKVLN_03110, partial [Rhodobacterales bacterium]